MDENLVPIEEEVEPEDKIPKCPLCQESLRMPRILPCFDVFCTECLERHFANLHGNESDTKPICPRCREPVAIPPGGVKDLHQATHVGFLSDILSKKSGQLCQYFCESEKKPAENYCIDCSLSMCASCRKMHSRVRGTDSHNVISLGDHDLLDVTSGMGKALKKRETPCALHDKQPLRFFCDACKIMVCASCAQEKHAEASDHKLEPLEKMAEERRTLLSDLSNLMQDYQRSTRKNLQSGSRYLTQLREDCSRAEKHVQSEAKVLISYIKARKREVLSKLQEHRLSEEGTVTTQVDALTWTDRQLNNVAKYAKEVLSYGSDAEVVEITPVLQLRFRDISDKDSFQGYPHTTLKVKISKVKVSPDNLLSDTQFGVTLEQGRPDLQNATIIKTLSTGDGSITGMAVTADDRIVVSSFCSKTIRIYKKNGSLVGEIKKGLKQPISVAVNSSQRLLVTDLGEDHHDMGVRMFTASGVALSDHVTFPNSPWGISVTHNGDMVVCHPEDRKVVIYSPDGTPKTAMHAPSGKQIFSNPRCVAVNINGDIIVSDFAKHRLLIFNPEGNLIHTYGSEGGGDQQLCHPCGVCCDQYGHILIADSNNNRIHVLSTEGALQGYVLSEGLDEPVAVEVDKNGDLVVGEWGGKIHVVRYL